MVGEVGVEPTTSTEIGFTDQRVCRFATLPYLFLFSHISKVFQFITNLIGGQGWICTNEVEMTTCALKSNNGDFQSPALATCILVHKQNICFSSILRNLPTQCFSRQAMGCRSTSKFNIALNPGGIPLFYDYKNSTYLARPIGVEPMTRRLEICCSVLLS